MIWLLELVWLETSLTVLLICTHNRVMVWISSKWRFQPSFDWRCKKNCCFFARVAFLVICTTQVRAMTYHFQSGSLSNIDIWEGHGWEHHLSDGVDNGVWLGLSWEHPYCFIYQEAIKEMDQGYFRGAGQEEQSSVLSHKAQDVLEDSVFAT